jgi:hypothetical protein
VFSRGNLAEALRRVEQNVGAAGIDGISTKEPRPGFTATGRRSARSSTRASTGRSLSGG